MEIGAYCEGAGLQLLIDVNSHVGELDLDTLLWWASVPEKAAKERVFSSTLKREPLKDALLRLNEFIANHKPTHFWGCSPDFDYGHLAFWFERYKIEIPWKYYQLRDVRTVRDFVKKERLEQLLKRAKGFTDCEHMALVDAKYEADIVREVRRKFDLLRGCEV